VRGQTASDARVPHTPHRPRKSLYTRTVSDGFPTRNRALGLPM